MAEFGTKVRRLRIANELTQGALAEALRISQAALSKVERNVAPLPARNQAGEDTFGAMVRILKVDADAALVLAQLHEQAVARQDTPRRPWVRRREAARQTMAVAAEVAARPRETLRLPLVDKHGHRLGRAMVDVCDPEPGMHALVGVTYLFDGKDASHSTLMILKPEQLRLAMSSVMLCDGELKPGFDGPSTTQTAEPRTMLVVWEQEVVATSPEEAARLARLSQTGQPSAKHLFRVFEQGGAVWNIHIEEPDAL